MPVKMPVKETMQVSEIMTDGLRVLSPNDGILKAACRMRGAGIGSLPVVSGNKPIGYVTDRDLVVRGLAAGLVPDASVQQVMSKDVVCCSEDYLVEDASQRVKFVGYLCSWTTAICAASYPLATS